MTLTYYDRAHRYIFEYLQGHDQTGANLIDDVTKLSALNTLSEKALTLEVIR